MKTVLLSADGPVCAYEVPNIVADNLVEFCCEFADRWLRESPHAKKYYRGNVVCYTQEDFIEYLNRWKFQNEQSKLIENLGWIDSKNSVPVKYRDSEWFNF